MERDVSRGRGGSYTNGKSDTPLFDGVGLPPLGPGRACLGARANGRAGAESSCSWAELELTGDRELGPRGPVAAWGAEAVGRLTKIVLVHQRNAFKRSLNISAMGMTVASNGNMGIRPASASTTAVLGSKGKALIRSTSS